MEENERFYALTQFCLKCFSMKGQSFQDFFSKIMGYSNPNFKSVKPWGRMGDRKNDGFIKNEGKYFQVYSPEKPENKINKTIKKLNEDFEGLYEFWNEKYPIKEFYFVFNSGETNPLLEEELSKLTFKYKNISFGSFLRNDLERVFMSLSKSQIQTIIGGIPSPEELLNDLDFSILPEVVKYILEMEFDNQKNTENLIAPDFDEKLKFNNLKKSGIYLNNAYFQIPKLNEFFSEFPKKKGLLQDKFSRLYLESLEHFPNDSEKQFHYILNKASPNDKMVVKTAIISLMAVYFESCDIFEEPTK